MRFEIRFVDTLNDGSIVEITHRRRDDRPLTADDIATLMRMDDAARAGIDIDESAGFDIVAFMPDEQVFIAKCLGVRGFAFPGYWSVFED